MHVIRPNCFIGVNPTAARYWAAYMRAGERPFPLAVPSKITGEFQAEPGQVWVIEYPLAENLQHGECSQAALDKALALRNWLLQRAVLVYMVRANRIRHGVTRYSARADGKARRYLANWLTEQGYHVKTGGDWAAPELQDALLAALWGELVAAGEVNGLPYLARRLESEERC